MTSASLVFTVLAPQTRLTQCGRQEAVSCGAPCRYWFMSCVAALHQQGEILDAAPSALIAQEKEAAAAAVAEAKKPPDDDGKDVGALD